LISRVAGGVSIPVFGSGDCVEADQVLGRLGDQHVGGVLVGRGALRNPWIFRQAADLAAGRPAQPVTHEERGEFLLEYLEMLLNERLNEADGFRHSVPGFDGNPEPAKGRAKWVINKLRALNSWYTKGLIGGSQLRVAINSSETIDQLRNTIVDFFGVQPKAVGINNNSTVAILPE
jgi:tRNA-dihydrouridine synthase B